MLERIAFIIGLAASIITIGQLIYKILSHHIVREWIAIIAILSTPIFLDYTVTWLVCQSSTNWFWKGGMKCFNLLFAYPQVGLLNQVTIIIATLVLLWFLGDILMALMDMIYDKRHPNRGIGNQPRASGGRPSK